MALLDAHLHLWDPQVLRYDWLDGALAHTFSADELTDARLVEGEPEHAVFVQADCVASQYLDEVRWVSGMAASLGIRAIVAGALLDHGADTVAHLEALAAQPLVVGVRHLLQDEADGFALSAPFLRGLREVARRGWTFDVCVRAAQLPDVTRLAAELPALRMVLDHLGKPEVGSAGSPAVPAVQWRQDLVALAQHPQVFCKLSGLPAEADGEWSAAQLAPFLDTAAEAFGPDRLLWGSDWPVSAVRSAEQGTSARRRAEYRADERRRWARTVADWARSRGIDEDALFGGTAARFYALPA